MFLVIKKICSNVCTISLKSSGIVLFKLSGQYFPIKKLASLQCKKQDLVVNLLRCQNTFSQKKIELIL